MSGIRHPGVFAVALTFGLLATALFVLNLTGAAYTDQTDNAGNNWAAGSVVLVDDDLEEAMFTVENMAPGHPVQHCIQVEYLGTLPTAVKLYGDGDDDVLANAIDLTVEEGSGATFGDCGSFVSLGSEAYTGSLADFSATHQDFASGSGTWDLVAQGDTRSYRFTTTLDTAADDSLQQVATGPVRFTWEANSLTSQDVIDLTPIGGVEPIVSTAAYTWGSNSAGQLGRTAGSSSATPAPVTGWAFADVAGGAAHTCGLDDGSIFCWGDNGYGQLGYTGADSPIPVQVLAPGVSFTSVTAGLYHTCALTTTQTAVCWGRNHVAQVGTGATSATAPVTAVNSGAVRFTSIHSGGAHNCAVSTAGNAHCWGYNHRRQVTGIAEATTILAPYQVSDPGVSYTTMATGSGATCGVTTTGSIRCWGGNYEGQLGHTFGLASTTGQPPRDIVAPAGVSFTSVSSSLYHSCALTTGQQVVCWGLNNSAQVGRSADGRALPLIVDTSGVLFTSVATGTAHSCGVSSAGAVYCWGSNSSGQLGRSGSGSHTPTQTVATGVPFSRVDAGDYHTVAAVQP